MSTNSENEFTKATASHVNKLTAFRQRLSDDIDDLIARRNRVDEQIHGLMAFLRATPGNHDIRRDEEHEPESELRTNGVLSRGPDHLASDNEVANIAYQVLLEIGAKDMHYVELAEKVKANGGRLPEHKPSATSMLNGILNADSRFIRPFRRGHYSLKEHFPNVNRSVGERRTKKRA